jgi:hypothetical protein
MGMGLGLGMGDERVDHNRLVRWFGAVVNDIPLVF